MGLPAKSPQAILWDPRKEGGNIPRETYALSHVRPPYPQEGAGKHYSYDRCRYLINAVSFMKAFITPEASKPWERKAAARSSAVAVS